MKQLSLELTNRWENEEWEDQIDDGQDKECLYNAILRRVFSGKGNKYYILWACVNLVIQHAMRNVRFDYILPHYFINCTIFEIYIYIYIEYKMCI